MMVASVVSPSLAGLALARPAASFLRTPLLSPGDALAGSASRSASGCPVARGGGARRQHISFAAGGGAVGDAFVVEGTTNVKFSRELTVPGSTAPLIILGTGYREKFFVKVYAAAFYVDYTIGLDTEKWREKVGIETFDASTIFYSIFKAPIVKSLSITLVRDVDGKTFVKALDDVIARRIKKPTVEEESSLSTFRNIFLGRNLKQGTSIYLTWSGPSVMLTNVVASARGTDAIPLAVQGVDRYDSPRGWVKDVRSNDQLCTAPPNSYGVSISISTSQDACQVDAEIKSASVNYALYDGFFGSSPVSPTLRSSTAQLLEAILTK